VDSLKIGVTGHSLGGTIYSVHILYESEAESLFLHYLFST